MFGTLHWKPHNKEAEFVERPHGSLSLEKNSACDRCRAKKVKCRTADDGCSRCKRLGKICGFRSMKHGGDQRIRRTGVNITQQGHLLDFLCQPSASSSLKDTGHEDRMCLDKQPFVPSPPADGYADNGDRGHQLLAELPADLTSFDLPSYLAEFGQQITSDQDGDNVSNLDLSPLPSIPTIVPSTSSESIQHDAARTPESRPTFPFISGDEAQSCLPPARQSQNSLVSAPDPIATLPSSLEASAFAPTAFSYQNFPDKPCQCLAAATFAVEKFETCCNSGKRAELDSIVAHQKDAVRSCHLILKCNSCMARRENFVLLVFMIEKIVTACGRTVILYRMKDDDTRAGSVAPFSMLGCLSTTDRHSHSINDEDLDLATPPASSSSSKPGYTTAGPISTSRKRADTSPDWRELLLGDYEISSRLEWEHLVRALIFLQLRALMDLLAKMKNLGGKVMVETQAESLTRYEIRIRELEKDIYIQ